MEPATIFAQNFIDQLILFLLSLAPVFIVSIIVYKSLLQGIFRIIGNKRHKL